jgi:DNA repair exonuclease SbcCD ATPase subunit
MLISWVPLSLWLGLIVRFAAKLQSFYINNLTLTVLQILAEQSQRELIDQEISIKVSQLNDEYNMKMAAAEKNFLEKLSSAKEENSSLNERMQSLHKQLSDLQSQHVVELSDREQQLTDLKKHFEQKLTDLKQQHEVVVSDMLESSRRTAAELDKVKSESYSRLQTLKGENVELQLQVENLSKLHEHVSKTLKTESESQLNSLLNEKIRLEERLAACEKLLEQAETDKNEVAQSHRLVLQDLENKVNDLNNKLLEAHKHQELAVSQVQESLEREHATVIAELQEKLTARSQSSERHADDVSFSSYADSFCSDDCRI